MDPTGIIAIIGAIGVCFQQIVNYKETKRRLDELEKAHEECIKRDKQREMELAELRAENKTVGYVEEVIRKGRDSDLAKIKIAFGDALALYDVKKKRITHIEKANPPAGETVGDP